MIGQVTNPTKGLNHYVTPEVEMVELGINSSFLDDGSTGGTVPDIPGGGDD